jgi:hypothetical protein
MATAKTAKNLPAVKKNTLPANLQEEMANEIEQFKNRIAGPSGNKIKTDDKIFTLPDGTSGETLSVVIVEFMANNAYYDKPWNPNLVVPPVCFAIGVEPAGLTPSENSPEAQAESCAACWANQWKSSKTGNGKACTNSRLLAVMAPDQSEDQPLMLLKVTPTALQAFDGYVASVARTFQRPPRGVITEISFDPNSKYPSLRFGNPVACSNEQLAAAYARREEAFQLLAKEPDVSSSLTPVAAPKPARKGVARKAG